MTPGFEVVTPDPSLFRNRFLEASAGTGKTFAIEQVVLRLVDQGVPLPEILVVTFTRAATLDLQLRLQKQLAPLALHGEEAKIWTIHSFCFQMLRNFPLLTGFLPHRREERTPEEALLLLIKDYLRTQSRLSPKQLAKVIRGNPDALVAQLRTLVAQRLPIEQPDWDYREACAPFASLDPEKLLEDLCLQAPDYATLCTPRREVKREVLEGLTTFTRLLRGEPVDPVDLPITKFVPSNLLKRRGTPPLHYPHFLAEAQQELLPKLLLFSDPKAILAHLGEGIRGRLEEVVEREEWLFYEDLLRLMAHHVENPDFAARVRGCFRAVLIDEFQDTDPLQWKIFSTLFLTDAFSGPLYLVGDPKQSIYRFRNADLYTYCAAKKAMGSESHASLQTNYRSTPSLVSALNRLFANESLTLPKTGEVLPYPAVAAASTLTPLDDGKGVIHTLCADDEHLLFSTIFHEIGRLHREANLPLSSCAVLVRDQFQAERFRAAATLPLAPRRERSLRDGEALPTLLDLLHALRRPRDRSAQVQLLAGPLFRYPLDAPPEMAPDLLFRYQQLLRERGLLALFEKVIADAPPCAPSLYYDLLQLVELGATSARPGEELAFYEGLLLLPPEAEVLKARRIGEEEGIPLMTIHVSKGLEFAVVFALGLLAPPPRRETLVRSGGRLLLSDPHHTQEEEEERKRMTYVACTRARQRLYLPLLAPHETPPLQGEGFSSEVCRLYPPPLYTPAPPPPTPPLVTPPAYPPLQIHSYSSLYPHTAPPPREELSPAKGVPAGRETGLILHRLLEHLPFEKAFRQKKLLPLVAPLLQRTRLAPWTEEITGWIEKALHEPLPDPEAPFPLAAVDPKKILKEVPFCFPSETPPGVIKGYIDLFFEHRGHYYLLDWKSHAEGESIQNLLSTYAYEEQGRLYRTAMEKYLKLFPCRNPSLRAVFFFFLRTQKVYPFLTE